MSLDATASASLSREARLCVHSLTLTYFRNYGSLSLESAGKSVILTGANGAGKTNLLEAISLLMPGRGLRYAKLVQLQHQPVTQQIGWGVAADVETAQGRVRFGTGQQPSREDKRIMRIDGEPLKGQAELSQHFAVLWQTPQMDGLFTQGNSERRHYYDRLCSVFLPDHSTHIAKYDYLRRERAKLLSSGRGDQTWLSSLERKMAETSLAIAATRLEMLEALSYAIDELHEAFPKAKLSLKGFAETALQEALFPAIEIEEKLMASLASSRNEDAKTGRASHGAHKTELEVIFEPKGVEAAYCSTGEQKALMLSLLLAQVQAMKYRQQRLPILLLDEVVAHLDPSRRKALFETLNELNCQSWMTGTDSKMFEGFEGALSYTAEAGSVK
ncbi:MAG: DNA replication/repair protein RecF [Rickettsiales bacterium]|nr:DNA replication/repair protein RecF [Rickettsiales bacterium]